MPVIPYVTAALLFGLGVYGVLRRRNAVLVLMAVELMLNAVNLILVTADATVRAALPHTGAGVRAVRDRAGRRRGRASGWRIVLQLYRLRASVAVDEVPLDDGAGRDATLGRPADGRRAGEPVIA